MNLSLKNLQKYRNTLFLFSGLIFIAVLLAISSFTTEKSQEKVLSPSPLPPTAAFSTTMSPADIIQWGKIKLGQSQIETESVLKKPLKSTNENGFEKVSYKSSSQYNDHLVYYQNDKSVRIDRFVNDRIEKITPDFYNNTFKDFSLIKRQGEFGDYQLQSYKVSSNEFIVLEYDLQFNSVYKIMNMTKDQYQQYLKSTPDESSEHEHADIEPWP